MNNISSIYGEFRERVLAAASTGQSLELRGGGSKRFYGRSTAGEILDTRSCSGVISYEPSELVITVFAGTPLV
jgi:FAD/FMN-containing dehydrogenases